MTDEVLYQMAREAQKLSYAPYSGFNVGAALLTRDGKVYTGCNIENASFSPTVCAERVAFFKAVSSGEKAFSAIAIAGGKAFLESERTLSPCGVCRQVMSEFCGPDFRVILKDPDLGMASYTLLQLFPLGFSPKNLG